MPNWCYNSIDITGPKEIIEQLWKDAQKEYSGLLNAMVPRPEIEDDEGWYSWNITNWGTKWDVTTEELELIDNEDGTASIAGGFDSAWGPPTQAYETFCNTMENCDIQASYHEPGMDFAGFWSLSVGDEYCEDLTEECALPEDERSELFNRLDDEFALVENYEMWQEDEEMED